MPVSDIPLFSMLRTRMQWHQERQKVLAENVANADTRNSARATSSRSTSAARSRPPGRLGPAGGQVRLASTNPAHIAASAGTSAFATGGNSKYDVKPAGNAVNLEDEMMKVAANQMDYQAAVSLYSRSMGLFRTALGKR